MSGKKGQIRRKSAAGTTRQKAWQSMRILRAFSIPDLMRTAGAKKSDNIRKLLLMLTTHGYLAERTGWVRGATGSHKTWVILVNPGPTIPTVCKKCGLAISAKKCGAPAILPPHPYPPPQGGRG